MNACRAIITRTKVPTPATREPLEAINPAIVSHGSTFSIPEFDWKQSKGCPGPKGGPVCGANAWHPGPEGGMAVNIMCAECGVKLWFSPPFASTRIYNDDKFYNKGRVQRLQDL